MRACPILEKSVHLRNDGHCSARRGRGKGADDILLGLAHKGRVQAARPRGVPFPWHAFGDVPDQGRPVRPERPVAIAFADLGPRAREAIAVPFRHMMEDILALRAIGGPGHGLRAADALGMVVGDPGIAGAQARGRPDGGAVLGGKPPD